MCDYKHTHTVYSEIKNEIYTRLTFKWHIGKHFER